MLDGGCNDNTMSDQKICKILELTYEGVWRVSASEAITIDVDGVTVEAALFEPATQEIMIFNITK